MAGLKGNSYAPEAPPRRPPSVLRSEVEYYVLKEAQSLSYFWPDCDAAQSQMALQDDYVENGTYILRKTGVIDADKLKFLTLSIKMDFSHDATVSDNEKMLAKVWHFPIKVFHEDDMVYYSITTSCKEIISINKLMEYHSTRPLKGGNLPGICEVLKGLDYKERRESRHLRKDPTLYPSTYIQVDFEPCNNATPPSTPRVQPRNPSTKLTTPPTSLPRTPSPTPRRRPLQPCPTPRENSYRQTSENTSNRQPQQPELPPPRDYSPRPGLSRTVEICECGIPIHLTYLPNGWEVHRSLEVSTFHMLYFKDKRQQTAWAPSPEIDKACLSREYLEYGRLNVKIFRKLKLDQKFSSELSNSSMYESLPGGHRKYS